MVMIVLASIDDCLLATEIDQLGASPACRRCATRAAYNKKKKPLFSSHLKFLYTKWYQRVCARRDYSPGSTYASSVSTNIGHCTLKCNLFNLVAFGNGSIHLGG